MSVSPLMRHIGMISVSTCHVIRVTLPACSVAWRCICGIFCSRSEAHSSKAFTALTRHVLAAKFPLLDRVSSIEWNCKHSMICHWPFSFLTNDIRLDSPKIGYLPSLLDLMQFCKMNKVAISCMHFRHCLCLSLPSGMCRELPGTIIPGGQDVRGRSHGPGSHDCLIQQCGGHKPHPVPAPG